MKVRSGFVSNSSSSSFVAIGFPIDPPARDADDEAWDAFHEGTITLDEVYIKGEYLTRETDCYLPSKEFTMAELMEKAMEISGKYNVDISQVKVYMGTRAC
jgi:beta-galactosidase/beta-glucuronidase